MRILLLSKSLTEPTSKFIKVFLPLASYVISSFFFWSLLIFLFSPSLLILLILFLCSIIFYLRYLKLSLTLISGFLLYTHLIGLISVSLLHFLSLIQAMECCSLWSWGWMTINQLCLIWLQFIYLHSFVWSEFLMILDFQIDFSSIYLFWSRKIKGYTLVLSYCSKLVVSCFWSCLLQHQLFTKGHICSVYFILIGEAEG